MRTIMLSLAAALLMGGAACKKTESEQAADDLKKAQERVEEKREDVREERKDVNEAVRDNEDREDIADERKDLDEKQRELQQAQGDFAAMRERFRRESSVTLDRIDQRIARLETKTDAESKRKAAELRQRRNEVSAKLDRAGDRTEANWNEFKTDVGESLNKLEKDVEDIDVDNDGK